MQYIAIQIKTATLEDTKTDNVWRNAKQLNPWSEAVRLAKLFSHSGTCEYVYISVYDMLCLIIGDTQY